MGEVLHGLRTSAALTLAGVIAWMPAGVAQAADTGTTPQGSRAVLEEIIVTGQRREEDLQNTGLSAAVLSGEELVDKSVFGLTSLQYATPSVTISDYGSANVFNIRGIGRSQVDVDLPSGVVIYRDGAPTLAGYFQNEPYFDMESVEIFRGPQGTFVGKSAAGGAVFINTRDPELGPFSASVEAGGGNFDQFEFTGVLNAPVSDTMALRVAYNHMQRNDYYDSIQGDYTGSPGERDLNSIRAGFLWAATEQLEVLLKLDYSDLDFGGNVTSSYGDSLFDVINQNAPFQYTDESFRAVLNLSYEFGGGIRLTSLTGYQDVETTNNLDLNATQAPFYFFGSHADTYIASQEFNLISPDDQRLRWVVGAFYQRQEFDIPTWEDGGFIFQGVGGTVPPFVVAADFPWITSPWDQTQDDWAVFAHAGFDLIEALELELGVRYSDYEMEQTTNWTFGTGNIAPVIPFGTPGGDSQSVEDDWVDGKVGLNWTVNEEHFLYGLVSIGHVSAGVNLFPPFLAYDQMEVINYELGWKATWADGTLRTQATTYYETFDNYQANFAMVGSALDNIATFRNAEGESKIWGAEVTGQLVLGDWGIDFGIAYLDSELGTFSDVIDPFSGEVVDLTGAKSPFSPEFTGNVGIGYHFRLGSLVIRPRVDYAHIGDTQAGLWDSPLITLEDRDLVNLQLTVRPEAGSWYVNLWGTNVTDEKFAGGIQNNGTLRYAAPPAMYGARFGISFD